MKKIFFYMFAVVVAGSAFSQSTPGVKKPSMASAAINCGGSVPCANTATGAAPADIAADEAEAWAKKIADTGSDKQRWEQITLYSDSTDLNKLKVSLVKAIGLQLRLDPKAGYLIVEKSGGEQVFAISDPAQGDKSVCPRYSIRVVDASPEHAVIEMVCMGYEFTVANKSRYYASREIYLLDLKTASLRSIWLGSKTDKAMPSPRPKPGPVFKKVANGYQLDWNGVNLADNEKFSVHNKYVRETDAKTGKGELVCTDLRAPKGEEHGGTCEGSTVPLIKNTLLIR